MAVWTVHQHGCLCSQLQDAWVLFISDMLCDCKCLGLPLLQDGLLTRGLQWELEEGKGAQIL